MYKQFLDPPGSPTYQSSRIIILPVPFDDSASWMKGASDGPSAIIDASHHIEYYDIETDIMVHEQGIFTAPPVKGRSSEDMVSKVFKEVSAFLKDRKFVMTLGGDHSISIGAIQAHQEYHKDISVLHLDAHADMRDTFHGSKLNHACVMARVLEFTNRVVSVGIRSMDQSEKTIYAKEDIFLAEDICCARSMDWIQDVIKSLKKKVYLSLDVDVFEIGLMPSTGTPQPGGLDWYQVIGLIKAVCKARELVGADVVELAPNATNKAPDALAAKLVHKILSYKFV